MKNREFTNAQKEAVAKQVLVKLGNQASNPIFSMCTTTFEHEARMQGCQNYIDFSFQLPSAKETVLIYETIETQILGETYPE